MSNSGREYMKLLKQVKKKKGNEPLTQQEIDALGVLCRKQGSEDKIKRNPRLGCLVIILGTTIFWSLIYSLFL